MLQEVAEQELLTVVPLYLTTPDVRLEPVIVTAVLAGPEAGLNEVAVGAGVAMTVNAFTASESPGVVTVTPTLPAGAPAGTVAEQPLGLHDAPVSWTPPK